ncbi:GntR family transcriptional regulator [Microbispora rosea subsp. aerata]|nr:PLP-dependent aminotransferase family protein [Microbispora rosea]GGO08885.1 GntR family transcriptional regulator [Microbispora rosea subsp. aerata]GIH55312.1 GntR family transcriptional regulator [Microbispora rosea subsp. aerata]GLJ86591.1 GntR family transcriptional regulator [Microbispora rosea subsp. aerata]
MADFHLVVDRAAGGLAGQIAREVREAVRSGRLVPGTRLPATRDLARDLGLSRGVVVEAYEQLVAEGLLESRTGAGTRVAAGAGRQAAPGRIAGEGEIRPHYGHRPTSPDLGLFPRQAWLAAVRHVLATLPNDALDYGDPGGVPALRRELAAYLGRVRAADASPDDVVVVTGVAQGLSLVVQALVRERGRGIVLAVEDPTSTRQLPLLRRAGADIVPVPVDGEGIVVAKLPGDADAVLVTPAHQYPTGVVLSPARRAALAEWAARTGALVLEDDYDAEFRFDRDPVGCLQGLAPDRVVLAGSVSKALAPGLRLGWIAAPPPVARAVRLARGELDLGSPVIDQYALAHLIASGAYDRHLRRMRREYRRRRDALVAALAEHLPWVSVRGISAGLHLYAEPGGDPSGLVAAARAAGLSAEVVTSACGAPGLVIGFARLPAHRVTEAVRALARAAGGS